MAFAYYNLIHHDLLNGPARSESLHRQTICTKVFLPLNTLHTHPESLQQGHQRLVRRRHQQTINKPGINKPFTNQASTNQVAPVSTRQVTMPDPHLGVWLQQVCNDLHDDDDCKWPCPVLTLVCGCSRSAMTCTIRKGCSSTMSKLPRRRFAATGSSNIT